MGIPVERMWLLAFALSGALGAVAGAVIAPITYATYDMGLMLGLKGFVAAVLGGLVSPPGAIAGGFLLGVLESLSAGYLSSGYKDAVAFVVLIVIGLVQAAGWLPWRVAEEGEA
jgi:branched-chain amino acid transport system permease protein